MPAQCNGVVTTTIGRRFDRNSTALRPHDDLRYDRAAALMQSAHALCMQSAWALCLSVCPSVCPSVPLSLPSVTSFRQPLN